MKRTVLFGILFALIVSGCHSKPSDEQATKGIYPQYVATYDGSKTDLFAWFLDGEYAGAAAVYLQNGDRIYGWVNGARYQLQQRNGGLFGKYYDYNLPGLQADGAPVRFDLERDADADAPNSIATLPQSFTLLTPVQNDVVSRQTATLTMTWSPAGTDDAMEIFATYTAASSSAIEAGVSTIPIAGDPGTWSVPISAVTGTQNGSYSVNLALRRKQQGSLDSVFRGRFIEGRQERSVAITVTP